MNEERNKKGERCPSLNMIMKVRI